MKRFRELSVAMPKRAANPAPAAAPAPLVPVAEIPKATPKAAAKPFDPVADILAEFERGELNSNSDLFEADPKNAAIVQAVLVLAKPGSENLHLLAAHKILRVAGVDLDPHTLLASV